MCTAEELSLSLPQSAFLRPAGIVLLAAGIACRQERQLRTALSPEGGIGDAYRYLQRIDFFTELGVQTSEAFQRHAAVGRFVPLRRMVDLRAAREVAEATSDCIEQQLPDVGPSPLRMARFVFEELGANVVQHSGAPRTGFGMAQAYPQDRQLEIAFADAGIGFRASLQRNPELEGRIEEDGEALQLAIGRAVSGRQPGRTNMGLGLSLLVDFADLLGGELRLASGEALLHRKTTVGIERASLIRSTAGWSGSWICLVASLPSGRSEPSQAP